MTSHTVSRARIYKF